MSEDEFRTRFELTRQSIGTWAAYTAGLVRAASEYRETGRFSSDERTTAEQALRAVQAERRDLADAMSGSLVKDDDLARGVEIALNELDLLERDMQTALGGLPSR